jgi:Dual specificity phosphatase, catalytic domain
MRWVVPGRLAAGPYPRNVDELRALGIDAFVDLTEAGELPAYVVDGVEHLRVPIRDFGTPSIDEMEVILATLDELLARGRVVYLHCRGGIGRTGTVLGCYLVRQGLRAEDALASISGPETEPQREFVLAWTPSKVSDTF